MRAILGVAVIAVVADLILQIEVAIIMIQRATSYHQKWNNNGGNQGKRKCLQVNAEKKNNEA